MMRHMSKFIKLSQFVPEYVASKRLKMRKFEEGLVVYIPNQLLGQSIRTYQGLCERAAEVKCVKAELKALNPNPDNQKRKWNE